MQVFAMLLNHDNEHLVQNVLWMLRNLSDVANKQVPLLSLLLCILQVCVRLSKGCHFSSSQNTSTIELGQ